MTYSETLDCTQSPIEMMEHSHHSTTLQAQWLQIQERMHSNTQSYDKHALKVKRQRQRPYKPEMAGCGHKRQQVLDHLPGN